MGTCVSSSGLYALWGLGKAPTTGSSSAQEAKEALAGAATKHISNARPDCGQRHQIHHCQPQKEGCTHQHLRKCSSQCTAKFAATPAGADSGASPELTVSALTNCSCSASHVSCRRCFRSSAGAWLACVRVKCWEPAAVAWSSPESSLLATSNRPFPPPCSVDPSAPSGVNGARKAYARKKTAPSRHANKGIVSISESKKGAWFPYYRVSCALGA